MQTIAAEKGTVFEYIVHLCVSYTEATIQTYSSIERSLRAWDSLIGSQPQL